MRNQICEFLNNEGLLNDCQSGFRKNFSTGSTLINISDDLTISIENGKISIICSVDLSNAFDIVCHYLLLIKLRTKFNFSSSAIALMKSYLTDRFQKVIIGSKESLETPVSSGVFQGSVLSPILFTMFCNDLLDMLEDKFKLKLALAHMYADDLQLHLSDYPENMPQCIHKFNNILRCLYEWIQANNLRINYSKCQAMIFTNKLNHNTSNYPNLIINDTVIPFVENLKILGIIFDSKLSWNKHIENLCRGIYGTLSKLWFSTRYFSTDMRMKLVTSLIIPRIIYCAPLISEMSHEAFSRLQVAFNSCARYIFRRKRWEHISSYSVKILNCSLKEYFKFLSCLFMHKIIYTGTPSYLANKIILTRSTRTTVIYYPIHRTTFREKSFFVHAARTWNSLHESIRKIDTFSSFRTKCFKEFSSS